MAEHVLGAKAELCVHYHDYSSTVGYATLLLELSQILNSTHTINQENQESRKP